MKKIEWDRLSRDGQNTRGLQEQLPDAEVSISSLGSSISGCFTFSCTVPALHGIMGGYHESWELAMNHGRLKLYETVVILYPRNLVPKMSQHLQVRFRRWI